MRVVEYLLAFVTDMGYIGVLITMVLVFSFTPFPSQAVLLPAGYLAYQGEMSFFLIVLFGTIGGTIGAHINYYLANKLGRSVIIKYGRYMMIGESGLHKAEKFFDNYGQFSITIGLVTPGIGQLITLPAGLVAMDRVRFFFSVLVGAFVWNLMMVSLGYFFGDNQQFFAENWEMFLVGLMGVVSLIIVSYIAYKRSKSK